MSKILLDYFFPISSITPTPAASTAFLKQVCLVVAPKSPTVSGTLTLCTSMTAVAVVTDNTEAQQFFDAGMSRVYILTMDDLDMANDLEGHESDFYTLVISSDFDDADIAATAASGIITVSSYANLLTTTPDVVTINGTVFTAQSGAVTLGDATFRAATSNDATAASLAAQINAHAVIGLLVHAVAVTNAVTLTALNTGVGGNAITLTYTDNGGGNIGITLSGISAGHLIGGDGLFLGTFTGVVAMSSTDDTKLATYAASYCAFHTTSGNKAKNMCYAFGKLLSNASSWLNQQYITMPVADDVITVGDAEALFDDRISFVISDDEFGKRLALFAVAGQAIVAPYIKRNLEIDLQSAALSYISGNQPAYTKTQAALIEDELQKVVNSYIASEEIEAGVATVTLEEDNFVATSAINIAEPGGLWRIFGEIRQTL